jgi:DNA-binding HxlR family transcriptional regulator
MERPVKKGFISRIHVFFRAKRKQAVPCDSPRSGAERLRGSRLLDLHNESDIVKTYLHHARCEMQHKSFATMHCPIARSLEHVGEWWSMLILRDALRGATRFDEFQKSLEIAPNILTRRLNSLVEAGLLERRRYSERPPRYEYLPTERARDFRPVLWMLLSWGNKHFAPEGPSVVIVDARTGARADPIVIDRVSGRRMTGAEFTSAPGPAADERIRRAYGFSRESSGSTAEGKSSRRRPARAAAAVAVASGRAARQAKQRS